MKKRQLIAMTIFTISILTMLVLVMKVVADLDSTKSSLEESVQLNTQLKQEMGVMAITIENLGFELEKAKQVNTSLTSQKETLIDKLDELRKQNESQDAQIKKLSEKEKKKVSVSRSNGNEKGKTIVVTATAYTAYCKGCSGVTATGIDLRKNAHLKVIAVDPNVIPLGSKVYVEGYGYAIAGDTGGAIKGSKIDLFMPNYSDAIDFGRKKVQVKILAGG